MSLEKLAALRMLIKELLVSAPLERYELSSSFGVRSDPTNGHSSQHAGIDLKAPYLSPVYATAKGVVNYSGIGAGTARPSRLTTATVFLRYTLISIDKPCRAASGSRRIARSASSAAPAGAPVRMSTTRCW
jgi:hypothetical protein